MRGNKCVNLHGRVVFARNSCRQVYLVSLSCNCNEHFTVNEAHFHRLIRLVGCLKPVPRLVSMIQKRYKGP